MKKKTDLVVHHNYLNESIFNFSELELNLFVVIIYKMRTEIKNTVIFKAKEIKSLINAKDRSYKKFEKVIHNLQDRTIYLKTGKGYKRLKPFPILDFDNENKTVEIEINRLMTPFFKELTEQFTKYSLKEFLALKSKHSKRLYQLLKQYESIGKRNFELDHLKEILECDTKSYSRMSNFEQRVLKTTKNDINANTSISIEYSKIKEGKQVKEIGFTINKKLDKATKNDKISLIKETRKDVIERSLKSFEKNYIKDLSIAQKKLLDTTLVLRGYKPTARRKGETAVRVKKKILNTKYLI